MRLIDADALIDKYGEWYTEEGTEEGYIGTIKGIVESMPTIEERKKGEWILVREADETGNALYECPVCHKGETHVPIVEVGYCWNCGAEMRGEENG